ncbi:hypothetical protein SUDANB99_06006 (plasmid) [Streptomyces sp. enrichment culture]
MYRARWLAATTPAKLDAFTYDDGNATGMYVEAVPWTFPCWLGRTAREAADTAVAMMSKHLTEHTDTLQHLVQDIEADLTVKYLDDLLTTRYNELPIQRADSPTPTTSL